MIMSRTPFRISFFGGGTDYPKWLEKEDGAVLSSAIDKYCYISARILPGFFAPMKHRIVWSHIEVVQSISEILHPAIREGLLHLGFDDSTGLEIHHQGDLPARTGTGSSSAFAVGLLNVLYALKGIGISKEELVRNAIILEQDRLKDTVGCQDQISTGFGGLNLIEMKKGNEFKVNRLRVQESLKADLQSRLLMVFTGSTRLSSQVSHDVVSNMEKTTDNLRSMRSMAYAAAELLEAGKLDDFGRLLHKGWMLKRGLSKMVSNQYIDEIYATALQSGALGGKLMGAGASGFMVFYVPPGKMEKVKENLRHNIQVPFKFDNEGSKITLQQI